MSYELAPSSISSFSDRHNRLRHRQRQDSDEQDSTAIPGSQSAPYHASESLLELFCVISHHKLQIFSVEPSQQWNVRHALGHGASFQVDQTGLPISSTLSHLRYRNLNIKGPDEDFHFTDHTGTRWAHNASVAFKSVRKKNGVLHDLVKELRVYCHKPIQQHPHIIRLLGIAFYTEQDLVADNDSASMYPGNRSHFTWQEIPLLVIESAPHASLTDFLKSPEFTKIPTSLKTKIRLCTEVLSAIEVGVLPLPQRELPTTNTSTLV